MAEIKENVIEWITGDDVIACTFTQRRFINKIYKLREKQPEIVSKFVQNADGSIFCHLPLKALKLYLNTRDEAGDIDEAEETALDAFDEQFDRAAQSAALGVRFEEGEDDGNGD